MSVKLYRPGFCGATRGGPANGVAHVCVAKAVREHLGAWFRERPEQADALVTRLL